MPTPAPQAVKEALPHEVGFGHLVADAHVVAQNDEAANVSRCFHTLGSVQMVDGMAKMGDGQFERTLFTSGYSSKTNTYYMNTYDDPAIRSYAMADYDMDSSELISVAR
mgnify:CR=1 FL=1